jgi:hypothetical protein
MGISVGTGLAISGAASAGSGILSGILGGGAASKAAAEQTAADQQALQFQEGVYANTQANLSPYISTGQNALGSVAQLYGLATPGGPGAGTGNALQAYQAYQKTPFYQFPLQQGTQTLQNSGAARGLTLSGGQSNALQAYGQGYASQNFGNYIQGLTGLAGLGQSSAVSLGSQGNQASQQVGNVLNNLGNAQAAGTVGQASGINNALSNIGPLLQAGLGANNSSFTSPSAVSSAYSGGGSGGGALGDPFAGNTLG